MPDLGEPNRPSLPRQLQHIFPADSPIPLHAQRFVTRQVPAYNIALGTGMHPNSSFLDILPGNRIYIHTGPVKLRYGTHKCYCHIQGSIITVGTPTPPQTTFVLMVTLTPKYTASPRTTSSSRLPWHILTTQPESRPPSMNQTPFHQTINPTKYNYCLP
jgi:hypothetical protein